MLLPACCKLRLKGVLVQHQRPSHVNEQQLQKYIHVKQGLFVNVGRLSVSLTHMEVGGWSDVGIAELSSNFQRLIEMREK